MIKIIIVDDEPEWAKKMNDFLNSENDFMVIGTATDKEKAIEMIKISDADIVLLDMNINGNEQAGIEITDEILKYKNIKIIIVTAYSVEQLIIQAFNAGAKHFFPKECYKDLPNAIRLSYNNVSPVEILLKKFFELKKQNALNKLTAAEKELFVYIEKGYSISSIAQEMNITVGTVKQHVNKILKKLNARRRDELSKIYF